MLLGAISKELDTIVEFTAFEDFINFDRKGKNKIKRTENGFYPADLYRKIGFKDVCNVYYYVKKL